MTPRQRHDEAVVQAEIRRLSRALRPYGVLRRDELEHEVGARSWHAGGFGEALDRAVRSGLVKRLPFGFYRLTGERSRL